MMLACACEHCGHEFEAEPEGGHRLLCGDATSASDVARLMDGEEADICFTSPPYAQQRDYKTGPQDWNALMRGVFSILPVKHGAQVLVNLGLVHHEGEWLPYWDGWIEWMRGAGWRRFGWYVWDQGPGLPGDWNGRLAPSHEFVFHFNRVSRRANKTRDCKYAGTETHLRLDGSSTGLRQKDGKVTAWTHAGKAIQAKRIPDSVVRVMRHKARGIEVTHPAVFPVDLVVEMLTAFSNVDDLAFEPFCGSGTQLIASEKTGHRCIAVELTPEYVDVAAIRWAQFTGRPAVLADNGRTFDEVAAARSKPE